MSTQPDGPTPIDASQNTLTAGEIFTTAPLGWGEKISYGLGDMGFNFYWANISAFLLIYYTDVFGISAAAAGTMMLITKIIDAVTDPLMGALADRTQSRFGKFRPYLLWQFFCRYCFITVNIKW